MLGNAYPNPSDGESKIPFTVSAEAGEVRVVMELYNGLGVKVDTIIDGQFSPGFYEADLNAKSPNLSNGMYLIKLSVAGQELRETHYGKLILTK